MVLVWQLAASLILVLVTLSIGYSILSNASFAQVSVI